MKDVTEMLTRELIQEYNALTGKSIEKFASRIAGEQQVTRARKAAGLDTNVVPEIRLQTHKPREDTNPVRAAGTRRSWDNIEVFEKRRERTNVEVDGHGRFRSVGAAFKAIGLPMTKHIAFRQDLKKQKNLEFQGLMFRVADPEPAAEPKPKGKKVKVEAEAAE